MQTTEVLSVQHCSAALYALWIRWSFFLICTSSGCPPFVIQALHVSWKVFCLKEYGKQICYQSTGMTLLVDKDARTECQNRQLKQTYSWLSKAELHWKRLFQSPKRWWLAGVNVRLKYGPGAIHHQQAFFLLPEISVVIFCNTPQSTNRKAWAQWCIFFVTVMMFWPLPTISVLKVLFDLFCKIILVTCISHIERKIIK